MFPASFSILAFLGTSSSSAGSLRRTLPVCAASPPAAIKASASCRFMREFYTRFPMRAAALMISLALAASATISAQDLPVVAAVEHQPLGAQVLRLIEALEFVGEPLPTAESGELRRLASAASDRPAAVAAMQKILDQHCLVGI